MPGFQRLGPRWALRLAIKEGGACGGPRLSFTQRGDMLGMNLNILNITIV